MVKKVKIYNRISFIMLFIGLPLLIYALTDFPRRSFLKEVISLLTIIAFFMTIAQFFISRANKNLLEGEKMDSLMKWHAGFGYSFIAILLLHPFLIVFPRYFEAGVEPLDAFMTMLTTFNSYGIIFGLVAWFIILILGITALVHSKIGLKYKTWRVFHGILSMIFLSFASLHVIDLGSHMNKPLSLLIIVLVVAAFSLLVRTYILDSSKSNVHYDK